MHVVSYDIIVAGKERDDSKGKLKCQLQKNTMWQSPHKEEVQNFNMNKL